MRARVHRHARAQIVGPDLDELDAEMILQTRPVRPHVVEGERLVPDGVGH